MRPGPTGWAMVAFLGVVAWTGEGGARAEAPGGGEDGAAAAAAAAARVRWVLDRIEEEVAVIIAGEETRTVPRTALGPGAREGDLLDERLIPDPAATARARAAVARLRRAAEGAGPGNDRSDVAAGAEPASEASEDAVEAGHADDPEQDVVEAGRADVPPDDAVDAGPGTDPSEVAVEPGEPSRSAAPSPGSPVPRAGR